MVLWVAIQKWQASFKSIHHSSYMHHNRQEMPDKHGRLHQLNFRVYFAGYIIMERFLQYKKRARSDSAQNLNPPKNLRPELKPATCSAAPHSSVPTLYLVRVLYHLILMASVCAVKHYVRFTYDRLQELLIPNFSAGSHFERTKYLQNSYTVNSSHCYINVNN